MKGLHNYLIITLTSDLPIYCYMTIKSKLNSKFNKSMQYFTKYCFTTILDYKKFISVTVSQHEKN